jgi:hypothetical protein
MNGIIYNPALTLRRIDPQKVVAALMEGKYNDCLVSEKATLLADNSAPPPIIDTDLAKFSLQDRNNVNVTMIVANPKSDKIKKCKFCHLDIEKTEKEYGRPIKKTVTESKETGDVIKTYTVVDRYNSLECMYTDFKRSQSSSNAFLNTHSCDKETLIKMLIFDLTGQHSIRDAYDPSLLEINGGNMSKDEYLKSNIVLRPSPYIQLLPASTTFVQEQ